MIFSNNARAPRVSPKRAVTAPRDVPNFSTGTLDIIRRAAAKTATAIAILRIVPAFIFFCQSSRDSFTLFKTSIILSFIPPLFLASFLASLLKSFNPFVNPLRSKRKEVNMPPLTRPTKLSSPPFKKISQIALPIPEAADDTFLATLLITSPIFLITLTNLSK